MTFGLIRKLPPSVYEAIATYAFKYGESFFFQGNIFTVCLTRRYTILKGWTNIPLRVFNTYMEITSLGI